MSPRARSYEAGRRRSPVRLAAVRVVRDLDTSTDASYMREEGLEDRLEAYERGQFHFYEMRIEADVEVEGLQTLVRSNGVDGIESDTTEEELDELIVEEWRALRTALKTVGVPTEELPLEVPREWIDWRM